MVKIRASTEEYQMVLEAAASNDHEFLESADGKCLHEARCTSGCTALHWASGHNHSKLVSYLIGERQMSVDIRATKSSKGRTPLHYACRNGCLETAKVLVEKFGADPDARAKQNVSPYQLAVWQNHLHVCRWLVEEEKVDPLQLNDFDCGAVHWIGICPKNESVVELAQWLGSLNGTDFRLTQRQGHTVLHKAAWGGRVDLIRYLRDEFGIYDDRPDNAGNYAADMAEMAGNHEVAEVLRNECSGARARSCRILGVPTTATKEEIRKAYLKKARQVHPDKLGLGDVNDPETHRADQQASSNLTDEETKGNADHTKELQTQAAIEFDQVVKAYKHLTIEDGIGSQRNPTHSLKLMLEQVNLSDINRDKKDDCFKARLIAVLLEYGNKGIPLDNLKKKWKQVWPDTPFPQDGGKVKLKTLLQRKAGDVVDIMSPQGGDSGPTRIKAKHLPKQQVKAKSMQEVV